MRGPRVTPPKRYDEMVIDVKLDPNSVVGDVEIRQEIMLHSGKISNHDMNHQL